MRNCKNSENVSLLAEKQNYFEKLYFLAENQKVFWQIAKKNQKLPKLSQTVKDISFLTKKQTVFWQLQKQFQTVKHTFPCKGTESILRKQFQTVKKYIFPDRETESILKNCKVFSNYETFVYIVPGKETVSILKNCKSCFKQWPNIYILTEKQKVSLKVTKTVSKKKIIAHCTCNVPLRLCAKCGW